MTRESSPPDAISRSGAAGTPAFGASIISTASAPAGPPRSRSAATSKLAPSIVSSASAAVTASESCGAAAPEPRERGRAACAREQAAPRLSDAVTAALAELAMEGASFDALRSDREAGPAGADAAEFLLAPNAGRSGGAASRGRLRRRALTGHARPARASPTTAAQATLVFDEIDAGHRRQHGTCGRRAPARSRPQGRQLLCITHLPQIASLAARHLSIEKDARADPARTTVRELAESRSSPSSSACSAPTPTTGAAQRHARRAAPVSPGKAPEAASETPRQRPRLRP